ncbi:hypothetical protein [Denitrobaculum tricleocarpae]|uniref:DUF2007 domain-containing protein n=1 Tax=Denitrobaculum tricleocarpae TaxID=2591009 RepID=A0A545T087_9PROT|nr:hypothetical protein [Denitrobaculum tricleocarpae]TQV70635.1 hypothetical protein FKG95_27645 [Denitrobaculum tricleocarpae]
MRRPNLTTVGYAYGVPEAAMAAALLESAGILVTRHPWHTVCVTWSKTHAFGGIEIQVPASQAEQAATILADFQPIARPRKRLFRLLVCIAATLFIAVPPAASGFFAVAMRPGTMRNSAQD